MKTHSTILEEESNTNDCALLTDTEFIVVLHDKLVPLRDAGIDEDLFLYWRKKGLLPFFPKGAWAKFSFAQLIWLQMLLDLRALGYSLEQMLKLADYLFKRAYDDDLPQQNLAASREQLLKKKVAGTINQREQETLDYLDDVLIDPELLYVLKFNINYLSNLLVICLNSGEETGLLLFSDGTIAERRQGHYYSVETGRDVDTTKPHIYLSMLHYLKTFVRRDSLAHFISCIDAFSDGEQKVIREIRDKRNRELHIELMEGRVQHLHVIGKERRITDREAEQIRDILGLNNFEKMVVDTVDDRTLMLRKTRKRA